MRFMGDSRMQFDIHVGFGILSLCNLYNIDFILHMDYRMGGLLLYLIPIRGF